MNKASGIDQRTRSCPSVWWSRDNQTFVN